MSSWWDPRHGPGWPNCDANHNRVAVTLDFGLGAVFHTVYTTGGVMPLLMAVAHIKAINDDPNDTRKYKVTVAGTYACRPMRTHNIASLHSVPVAIDINPQNNAMNGGRGDIPQWFADCFITQGFEWGLAWNDAMHFENGKWYGAWDGTYPEVDDVALTPDQAEALQFIKDNEDGLANLIDIAKGITIGADPAAKTAGSKATLATQAGFRAARELNLEKAGGH